jgi:hypothetical protein
VRVPRAYHEGCGQHRSHDGPRCGSHDHPSQTTTKKISIQDRAMPEAEAEKAFKRVEEIFSKYLIAQT